MEKSEPTLVPQWLRNGGSSTGGGTTIHPLASSSLHSDDRGTSKLARNNSFVNKNDQSLGRSSVLDRTTSSYFRRSSSSNGSANMRNSSSLSRNNCDKDWFKDAYESPYRDDSSLGEHWHRGRSDPPGNILSRRVGKERLRPSQSRGSGGRRETWSRKVVADSTNADITGSIDNNWLLAKGIKEKATEEREKEKLASSKIGRVPSPGLSSAIQSLPVAASAMIGSDKWKSALAEVPGTVGKAAVAPNSASVSLGGKHSGLNMAEAVAQGPPRAQITPQLSTELQRLEELAIKQSRQLIPMTPSMPKALVLNPSDKLKTKVGQQQQHPMSSFNGASQSPRGGLAKPDLSRASSVGKLHVLKPAWERNGASPAKDIPSPINEVANSTCAAAPLVAGSPTVKSTERKLVLPLSEKRPMSQVQSRNDFFNLMRKKSVGNSSSVPDVTPTESPSAVTKPDEIETATSPATKEKSVDASASDSLTLERSPENDGDKMCNSSSCNGQKCLVSGKSNSSFDSLLFPEEEEADLLRRLGWEENGEEGGLTEEEITAFYNDLTKYINAKPTWKILQGSIAGISSGLILSKSKLES